ncbi:MAG TPA: hypothetical protein VFO84_04105 [Dehalococcoidia bacterium]|nr:hypothetical protein [Dehalococcoidia bacterium]
MAKRRIPGPGLIGAIRRRSQVFNSRNHRWTKRNVETGRFMNQKSDGEPFKRVRRERAAAGA